MQRRQIIERDDFGVLTKVYRDNYNNLWIESASGNILKMTTKFQEINFIENKAKRMIGNKIKIFTSQTTANWSSIQYFCDVALIMAQPEDERNRDDFWDNISGEDGYIGDGVYAPGYDK